MEDMRYAGDAGASSVCSECDFDARCRPESIARRLCAERGDCDSFARKEAFVKPALWVCLVCRYEACCFYQCRRRMREVQEGRHG